MPPAPPSNIPPDPSTPKTPGGTYTRRQALTIAAGSLASGALLFGLGPFIAAGCSSDAPPAPAAGSPPDLKAHTQEFKREVIEVEKGVHLAIGFGLANSILLEGPDGLVVVDTMESAEAAADVLAAFRKISDKPIKAIIYTHFHTDHTFGTRVFMEGQTPDIWSHQSTNSLLDNLTSVVRSIIYTRSMRQFGTMLGGADFINAGIGPLLKFDRKSTLGLVRPTRAYDGPRAMIEAAGLKLELIHAPGETPDQTVIWLPDRKILLPADNYYKSFPNLYAIRGTPYRDVTLWVNSLDVMRRLGAEVMIPHHTRPVRGGREVFETLTNYRDAIGFVHDQTVRGMNRGLGPDELVETVRLPAHLADLPYLKEYYGTVAWSVRSVFSGYLGWFDGNPTRLFPLAPLEKAKRMADLAGGVDALKAKVQKALDAGDAVWAMELADHLAALDNQAPGPRQMKAKALVSLGERQSAATARNYCLTRARELDGSVTLGQPPMGDPELVHQTPLEAISAGLAVRLDPEKSADVQRVVGFRFPDVDRGFTVAVRRGVAEIKSEPPDRPDIMVTAASTIWKEIAAGLRSPAVALASGDIQVEGGTLDLVRFMRMFSE